MILANLDYEEAVIYDKIDGCQMLIRGGTARTIVSARGYAQGKKRAIILLNTLAYAFSFPNGTSMSQAKVSSIAISE